MQQEDIAPMAFYLLLAGRETTTSLITNSLFMLLQPKHRRQLKRLQKDKTSLDSCLDEVLRYCSPVSKDYRQVHAETTAFRFKDCLLRPGQTICFVNAAANKDRIAFGHTAYRFITQRGCSRKHLGSGLGAHFGSRVAKLQAKCVLEHLLLSDRFPELALALTKSQIRKLDLDSTNMISALPVRHKAADKTRARVHTKVE